MVDLEPLDQAADIACVRNLLRRHVEYTGSTYAGGMLQRWIDVQPRFVKVMPKDYKRVLAAEAQARAEGRAPTFAELVGATSG
jgi:glutamate synthase domain-containing protein 3